MSDHKLVIKFKTPVTPIAPPGLNVVPIIPVTPPVLRATPVASSKIDLRSYRTHVSMGSQSNGKELIIDVMNQLIDHTETIIRNSVGENKKKNQFRLSQFKKAVSTIRSCPHEILSGHQAKELPGIGKGISDRIDEIIRTKTLAELSVVAKVDEKTRTINELTTVTGIGETNAKRFIEQGVTGLDDLRTKVSKDSIKLTHHMQIGLKYYQDFQSKIPFQEVADLGKILKSCVHELYPDVLVEICGSHRRQRPFSGDIDVLMTHQTIMNDDDLIMSQVHYLKDIVKVLKNVGMIVDDLTSHGDTKYMGVCSHPETKIGRRIDIRFVTFDSFYPAIVYFTGSMMLNKIMRTIALQKGYTLNEYGLYHLEHGDKETKIVVHSEKEIFNLLDLVYLEPTEREII